MAASAASVIAMAGDRVLMNRGSQLMIHDAWGLTVGNAEDMADAALMLGKMSDSLADIYAARAGGTSDDWRTAMRAESWYTAAEAVEAGLADALVDDTDEPDAKARYDLRAYAFAYAGRSAAPAPTITPRPAAPTTSADPAGNPKTRGAGMDPAKIREALGLGPDAPDSEVTAAFAAAGLAPAPTPETDEPEVEAETPKAKAKKPAASAMVGTTAIDNEAWEASQARIKSLEARLAKQDRDERDKVIAQAIKDGKFSPARRELYASAWDKNPEGTREIIGALMKNAVPVEEVGYGLDGTGEPDEDYLGLYPTKKGGN
jgi:hypothetical protein